MRCSSVLIRPEFERSSRLAVRRCRASGSLLGASPGGLEIAGVRDTLGGRQWSRRLAIDLGWGMRARCLGDRLREFLSWMQL